MTELWFHDRRRTAVWLFVQAGVERYQIKRTIGHRSDSIFERYTIFRDRDADQVGRRAEGFLGKYAPQRDVLPRGEAVH